MKREQSPGQGRPHLICLCLLSLLATGLGAQPADPDPKVPLTDTLVQPLEILRDDRIPAGTFIKSPRGYVLTAGAAFQGPPPPGTVRFTLNGQEITDIAAFNNGLVERAEKAGADALQLEEIRDAYLIALKADPQFFPLLFNLGRIFLLLRLPEKALLYLERAQAQVPDFAGTYFLMAAASRRLGDHRSTLAHYRKAFQSNPFDPEPLIELGHFYLEQKAGDQARYYFHEVLRGWPTNSSAKIGLARLYLEQKNLYQAREILYSIDTEDVDGKEKADYNRLLHYYLATIATELRDYAEAVRQYDRLLAHPDDPFFLETPIMSIQRRRDIAFRLAEVEGSELMQ